MKWKLPASRLQHYLAGQISIRLAFCCYNGNWTLRRNCFFRKLEALRHWADAWLSRRRHMTLQNCSARLIATVAAPTAASSSVVVVDVYGSRNATGHGWMVTLDSLLPRPIP